MWIFQLHLFQQGRISGKTLRRANWSILSKRISFRRDWETCKQWTTQVQTSNRWCLSQIHQKVDDLDGIKLAFCTKDYSGRQCYKTYHCTFTKQQKFFSCLINWHDVRDVYYVYLVQITQSASTLPGWTWPWMGVQHWCKASLHQQPKPFCNEPLSNLKTNIHNQNEPNSTSKTNLK